MGIYLVSQGQRLGPYSLRKLNDEIVAGRIRPADWMAWHKGCAGWIPLAGLAGVNTAPVMPPGMTAAPPPPLQGDVTGGVIPYKNPQALIAYYCSMLGLLPLLGIPFALAAVILGPLGRKRCRQNPVIKGEVHAWIGIVLGWIALLFQIALIAIMIAVARSR